MELATALRDEEHWREESGRKNVALTGKPAI